jgi:hypothetical protein
MRSEKEIRPLLETLRSESKTYKNSPYAECRLAQIQLLEWVLGESITLREKLEGEKVKQKFLSVRIPIKKKKVSK